MRRRVVGAQGPDSARQAGAALRRATRRHGPLMPR